MKLGQKIKNELWWLIISVDYDYSRLTIADHDLTISELILYVEDKNDFKNTLDECLQLAIPVKDFKKFIVDNNFNSYEKSVMHPKKKYMYNSRVEISSPLDWYNNDASLSEQQWVREGLLKMIVEDLVGSEVPSC